MKRPITLTVTALLLIGLVLAGAGLAAGPATVPWNVLAGGGGHEIEGPLALDSIIGTWYSLGGTARVYMPVICK